MSHRLSRQTLKRSIAVAAIIIFLFPHVALTADIFISPSSRQVAIGETVTIRVFVSSDDPINTASGNLSFPSDKLSVVSVSKANSIIDLWVKEPSYSNSAANMRFEGISFNPGYTGPTGQVVSYVLRTKKLGTAPIVFTSASVLANDGRGTEVLNSAGGSNIIVVEAADAPQIAPPAQVATPTTSDMVFLSATDDETNPTREFLLEDRHSLAIVRNFTASIDKSEFFEIKNGERFVTPLLDPGTHTLTVMATSTDGEAYTFTYSFVIEPLPEPIITSHPRRHNFRDDLIIQGEATPFSNVTISVQGRQGYSGTFTGGTDEHGVFTIIIPSYTLPVDTFNLVARAKDHRSAHSLLSQPSELTTINEETVLSTRYTDQLILFAVLLAYIFVVMVLVSIIFVIATAPIISCHLLKYRLSGHKDKFAKLSIYLRNLSNWSQRHGLAVESEVCVIEPAKIEEKKPKKKSTKAKKKPTQRSLRDKSKK